LWNKIKINVLTVWNSLKNYLLGLAKGILDYFLNWTIIGAVIKHWDEIKLKTITVWNYLKGLIAGVAGIIWQTVSDKFNSVKNTVSNIWESVKNTISDKIQSAKNLVRDGLDAIKGFFDRLKLKLPHIPLPHFSIRGSFSLNPPSVPSLGVNWYKNGGVFNGDSIIGVGEAGAEAVVPLTGHRMIPFAKAIAEQMPNGGNSNGNGHVTIEVPVVLDGREVARITAKHMASELLRMGTKAVRSRGQ
jgi:phage-related protein